MRIGRPKHLPDPALIVSGTPGALRSGKRTPSPALRDFVSTYWTLESGGSLSGACIQIIPDGSIDLTFDLHRERSHVTGASQKPARHVLHDWGRANLLGIRFRPAGAYRFLQADASVFGSDWQCLESVAGAWATNLMDRLLNAASLERRIRLLDDALLGRLTGACIDPLIQYAINAIEQGNAETTVAALAKRIGVTERHLVRLFDRWVGFGPKRFARIARIRRLLVSATKNPMIPWGALAFAHGFADQSHLTRELVALTDMTPGEYRTSVTLAAPPSMSDLFKKREP